jgi:TolB-like protein
MKAGEAGMSFWWEVKRRNLFRVAIAYAILVWLLVQIVSRIFSAQDLPAWAIGLVATLLVVGLPVVLYLTWIVAGKSVAETEGPADVRGDDRAPNTIAVLPFEDLSRESDQKYFVDGLSEELLNRLTRIPGLRVIARTSSFSFKGSNQKVQEIAKELGVAHILEGSVRKAGDKLRINAQLVRTSDGFYLWSETYNRKIEDIFSVQADIATAVAGELCSTLGVECSMIPPGGTENVEAYELYLFAQGLMLEGDEPALKRALDPLDAALAIDSGFVLAWVSKAMVHNFLAVYATPDRSPEELDKGLKAALTAIELDPDLGAAHGALGHNRSFRGEWIEAENAYRRAFDLATGPISRTIVAIPIHYLSVGNFKKAHELLVEIREKDPLNNPSRAFYMLSFALMGNRERAEVEYERGRLMFGNEWLWGNIFIMLIRLGSGHAMTGDMIPPVKNSKISGEIKKYLGMPEEGLAKLHLHYAQESSLSIGNLVDIAFWSAHFGDAEFAMEVMEKVFDYSAERICYFWFPAMRDVRRTPRFRAFVRKIGLVDYWKEFGWPDICHPLENGDFICD